MDGRSFEPLALWTRSSIEGWRGTMHGATFTRHDSQHGRDSWAALDTRLLMRIALASKEFAPFQGWGAGTYASLAARALADAGHEVHVVTGDARTVREGPKLRTGVQFHFVDQEGTFPKSMAGLPAFAAQPQRYSWALWETLRDLHERKAFDAIEFPDFLGEAYFSIRAKRTLGAFAEAVLCVRTHMTIRHIRAINQDDWLDQERATVEHMEAWAIRHADALVPPCEGIWSEIAGEAARQGMTLPAHRVIALPIPLEQQREEMGWRASSGGVARVEVARGEVPTIVYCGRYERRKGVHVLVEAVQRLLGEQRVPSLRVRLIGEDTNTGPLGGSYRAWLETMIEPAHRDVFRFVPRVDRASLGVIYRDATCVCVPSLWENFPFACTEAMAMGCCVVGTDAGGMCDIIIDGESGLLAKAGDAESLASCIERVVSDEGLRTRTRANAPERIRVLCEPRAIANRYVEFLAEVREARDAQVHRTRADSGIVRAPSETPLVSVIVPIYNLHEFLPDTLRSLREQTMRDFETIVVDDGSTDPATIASLEALERTSDGTRLRILRLPHAGLSAARNAGVGYARGRYVLPLDSDDMLEAHAIERFVAAHDRNPDASFVTSPLRSFDKEPDAPVAGWIPLGGEATLMPVMNAASSSVALMVRDRVLEVGGYDVDLPAYEDWDLYCRMVQRFGAGEVVPEFLVVHRLRGSSMMHTLSRKRHHLLRARLNAKYVDLSPEPGRTARLMLGDCIRLEQVASGAGDDASVEQRALELVQQNVRYRIADKANAWLKRLALQQVVKGWFARP